MMNISYGTAPVDELRTSQCHEWDWEAGAEVPPGSHLITSRNGYYHHGIYLGGHQIVHYSGLCAGLHAGPVEVLALHRFASGKPIWIKRTRQPGFERDEVVRRALSRVGENQYRLLTNNCEHFCNWCLYGESRSDQVRNFSIHPLAALRLLLKALPGLLQQTTIAWSFTFAFHRFATPMALFHFAHQMRDAWVTSCMPRTGIAFSG